MNAEIVLFTWSSLTFYFFACFTFWLLLFTCHSLQPPSTSGPTALQLYWALLQPTHWYRKRKDTKRRITVLDGSKSLAPLVKVKVTSWLCLFFSCSLSCSKAASLPRDNSCDQRWERFSKWSRQTVCLCPEQERACFWQNKKNQQR